MEDRQHGASEADSLDNSPSPVILVTDAELAAIEDSEIAPWTPLMRSPARIALCALGGVLACLLVLAGGGPATGGAWALAAWCLIAATLPALSMIDIATHRLPDAIVLPLWPLVITLLVADVATGGIAWQDLIVGGACAAVTVLAFGFAWLRGLSGLGDAKLGGIIALALGVSGAMPAVAGIVLIPGLLAIFPLAIYVFRGGNGSQAVAFGPLLALGGLCAMVFSQDLSAWVR